MDKCKKCKGEIVGVEYRELTGKDIPFEHQYDGISEWICAKCGRRIGRWSGRELEGDDYEKIYGI